MSKVINIQPVTRIEGHSRVAITLDDAGNVVDTKVHVQTLRGFEKFCEGRPVEEMPRTVCHICGICPWAHHLASSKAADGCFGVTPPPTAVKLRRMMQSIAYVSDKILNFYFLAAPDFVIGPDADTSVRNVVGILQAAPDIAKKNIAMPIEFAIPKVHKFLCAEGIRDKITLIASGGIRTAYDVLKAIALGADGVVIGTAEMVALGCVRCACCESGRGCPRGIASTDPELIELMSLDWATQRLINLQNAWHEQMVAVLKRLGIPSIRKLRGRSDVLCHIDSKFEIGNRRLEKEKHEN